MEYYIEIVAKIIEAIGIIVILFGLIYALIVFLISAVKKRENCYVTLRKSLGSLYY